MVWLYPDLQIVSSPLPSSIALLSHIAEFLTSLQTVPFNAFVYVATSTQNTPFPPLLMFLLEQLSLCPPPK